MPVKSDREYRSLVTFGIEERENTNTYTVVGYASTFDSYTLMTIDGVDYKERIDRHAFDAADMSDVILQYDHTGKVLARTSNKTLKLEIDEHGLKVTADLSTTTASRELYDEIKSGLITKMSFAFKVNTDHYESDSHTRVVDTINKVYDVSAVSIPANPGTEIASRDYFNGVIEAEKAERLERERKECAKKALKLKLRLMEV